MPEAAPCFRLLICHQFLPHFATGSPDTRPTTQSAATKRSVSLWLRCETPMAVATRSTSAAIKGGESFNPPDISNCGLFPRLMVHFTQSLCIGCKSLTAMRSTCYALVEKVEEALERFPRLAGPLRRVSVC